MQYKWGQNFSVWILFFVFTRGINLNEFEELLLTADRQQFKLELEVKLDFPLDSLISTLLKVNLQTVRSIEFLILGKKPLSADDIINLAAKMRQNSKIKVRGKKY